MSINEMALRKTMDAWIALGKGLPPIDTARFIITEYESAKEHSCQWGKGSCWICTCSNEEHYKGQPDENTSGFLVDLHRKDFTLEKALDFLRAHNDGIYKITASKHLDELVAWLLAYLQRPTKRESVDELIASIRSWNGESPDILKDSAIHLIDLWRRGSGNG